MTERTNVSLPSLLLHFLALVFMSILTYPSKSNNNNDLKKHAPNTKRKKKQQITKQPSSSWDQIKNLLTCKQIEASKIHDPSRPNNHSIYTSCSSICTFRDVVHANARVVHRADNSPESSTLGQESKLVSKKSSHGPSCSRSVSSGSVRSGPVSAPNTGRAMQLRKLSGCYECHAIVDSRRYPLPRTTICACSECGEVFPKAESLEHHQAIRHAGKLDELSQKCTTGHKTVDKTAEIGPYSRPYYKRPKSPPDSQTYTKRATKRLSFARIVTRIAVRLEIQLLLIFKACDFFLYYFV